MISKYEFIDAQKAFFPTTLMCVWAAVSRSGFYDWLSRPTSATAARREELESIVAAVFEDSDGTYGYRRIHAELVRGQVACSPELVRAVMRSLGLYPCQPKPFRPTTTTPGDATAVPDLVARDFTAPAPGVKLVGDITYIPTWRGWAYLATVIDCHTKECIGWAIADHTCAPTLFVTPWTWLPVITTSPRIAYSTPIMPSPALSRGSPGWLVLAGLPDRFLGLTMWRHRRL